MTKSKTKPKSTPTVSELKSVLLDLDDEINELIEILDCLPELRIMTSAVSDLIEPQSKHTDRLNRCASETFNQSLDKYLSDSAKEFINHADTTCLSDIKESVEMIPVVVQWRLYRVQALLTLARG